MDLELRGATSADVQPLLAFWATAAENVARPTDTVVMVRALLTRDPEAMILATVDEKIIGTIIAGWDGWRCHLYRLAVDPAHRGQGIATQLVDAAEARLAQLGATRIDAMVLDANAEARGFWRGRGYAPQDDWSRWVKAVHPAVATP